MPLAKTDATLLLLLTFNICLLLLHIIQNCNSLFYFFQLTIIGQIIVISNFFLSIVLHQRKSKKHIKHILSRFHLVGLSLEAIVVIGFWGLRIFFTKGIIREGEVYTLYSELLSIGVHGISFLTMFYFVKTDQIVMEKGKAIKYLMHLGWGIPFLGLQFLRWYLTGDHIYGFLKQFSWVQLIVFEMALYFLSVTIDYTLTLRHGLKLTIKAMSSQRKNLDDLQSESQDEDARDYERELSQTKEKKKRHKYSQ